MTGFAQAAVRSDGLLLTITVRSVNHRFLDLHLRLPEPLLPLEPKARKQIQQRNLRGHLELKVALEREGGSGLRVDEALLGRYLELFRRLGEQYHLPAETDLATLAQLPGVITVGESSADPGISPELEAAFLKALEEAIERWDEMRAQEATLLEADFRERIARIRHWMEQMDPLRLELLPQVQKRLQERLQALSGEAGLEPVRLAQEAAVLADRTDVSEEVLRLKAHAAQFLGLLESEADAGRKMDFLLQEMHRELNTLLAKVAGFGETGLEITQLGLEIKAEVEKLREQVQNVQ